MTIYRVFSFPINKHAIKHTTLSSETALVMYYKNIIRLFLRSFENACFHIYLFKKTKLNLINVHCLKIYAK